MRVDVGHPVAHRLVDRVLERPAPGVHGDDLGAEQAHPGDVQGLPPGVLLAHVDDALEAEQRRGRRGGDAVLARAGLGDHPASCPSAGEQRLAQHVVDLVRPGVVEVLALEQDPRATGVPPNRRASVSGLGRPVYVRAARPARPGTPRRSGPSRTRRSSSSSAAISASGTNRPPYGPKCPVSVRRYHVSGWCLMAGWAPAATRSATADRGSRPVTNALRPARRRRRHARRR